MMLLLIFSKNRDSILCQCLLLVLLNVCVEIPWSQPYQIWSGDLLIHDFLVLPTALAQSSWYEYQKSKSQHLSSSLCRKGQTEEGSLSVIAPNPSHASYVEIWQLWFPWVLCVCAWRLS